MQSYLQNGRILLRTTQRSIWISLVSLVCGLGLALSASAQTFASTTSNQPEIGNVTGSAVTPEGMALADTQQAKDKVAATLAWNAAMKVGDTVGAANAVNTHTSTWGGTGVVGAPIQKTSSPSAAVTPMAPTTDVILGVQQVNQTTAYYCGPAAGYEIIRYLGGAGFTSRLDGSALSQANLANANHMNTDFYRSTDWARGQFVTGVNNWRGVNYYVQVHAPSATLLPNVFTYSMDANGMPFSGDTVEFVNSPHYNGHPINTLIGHWITAYGYSMSGAVGYWTDSSVPYFPGAAPYFQAYSDAFSSYLQSNGIAY
jgi:hypothetical protein